MIAVVLKTISLFILLLFPSCCINNNNNIALAYTVISTSTKTTIKTAVLTSPIIIPTNHHHHHIRTFHHHHDDDQYKHRRRQNTNTNAFGLSTSSLFLSSSSSMIEQQQQQQKQYEKTITSNSNTNPKRLLGCICLVTGASRGIGKGIAVELGKEGATVYITGTSSSSRPKTRTTSDTIKPYYNGTIEETAQIINNVGGIGIPVYCDHSNDHDVQQLFERIKFEQNGILHILVNNALRTPNNRIDFLLQNFWEYDIDNPPSTSWDAIHTVGLRSHYIASCYAMPLMFETLKQQKQVNNNEPNPIIPRPLVIMISSFGGISYTFNIPYGVGKAGVDRLTKDMNIELKDSNYDISIISLYPGVVLTEVNHYHISTAEWDQYVNIPTNDLSLYETIYFTGKAVVALALDNNNGSKSGSYQVVAELAKEYQFNDIHNKCPPSIRSLQFLLPMYSGIKNIKDFQSLIPDWKIPFWLMMQGGKPPSPTSSKD